MSKTSAPVALFDCLPHSLLAYWPTHGEGGVFNHIRGG